MDLLIMSLEEAAKYIPTKKTYGIRIGSEFTPSLQYASLDLLIPLEESENWLNRSPRGPGNCYVFDDIHPKSKNIDPRHKLFDKYIAENMLRSFEMHRSQTEALLVHCKLGKNRSPAVGIAFNEIFDLGHNNHHLKEKYPEANWHVYETLLKTAKGLKIF